nr:AIF_HP1_G0030670.mRNA.1.CDS.1 [Saccharomyces cerevisiae]
MLSEAYILSKKKNKSRSLISSLISSHDNISVGYVSCIKTMDEIQVGSQQGQSTINHRRYARCCY